MSYQAFARKYRPQKFGDLVGQQHISQALINNIKSNKIHHAYLFTGSRGVGKTTIARIFAKVLNCHYEENPDYEPCGKCSSCTSIVQNKSLDLIEVDAASRTKVEDTRELLDNVQYPPVNDKYKIYLIDEVHMLSKHSFNALLKTLEEPPAYIKFLLATTEPNKLPTTILSRCVRFNLKLLPSEYISNNLASILTKEKIKFEYEALNKIAQLSQGSLRDSLNLLEYAVAISNNNLTQQHILDMVGGIPDDDIYKLLIAINNYDVSTLKQVLLKIHQFCPDYNELINSLLDVLYKVSMQQLLSLPKDLDNSKEHLLICKLSNICSKENIQIFFDIAMKGKEVLTLSPSAKIGFDMTVLRMFSFKISSTNNHICSEDNQYDNKSELNTPPPK